MVNKHYIVNKNNLLLKWSIISVTPLPRYFEAKISNAYQNSKCYPLPYFIRRLNIMFTKVTNRVLLYVLTLFGCYLLPLRVLPCYSFTPRPER